MSDDIIKAMRKINTAPIKIDEMTFLKLYVAHYDSDIDKMEEKEPITLFRNIVNEYDRFIRYVNRKDNRVLFYKKYYTLVDFPNDYKEILKLEGHTFIKIKSHTKNFLTNVASVKNESLDKLLTRMLNLFYDPIYNPEIISYPMTAYLNFAENNLSYIKEMGCVANGIASEGVDRLGISISKKNAALLQNLQTLEFLKTYDAAIYFLFFLIFDGKYCDYILNNNSEQILKEKCYEEMQEHILSIKLKFSNEHNHYNDIYYEYMVKYIYMMNLQKKKEN